MKGGRNSRITLQINRQTPGGGEGGSAFSTSLWAMRTRAATNYRMANRRKARNTPDQPVEALRNSLSGPVAFTTIVLRESRQRATLQIQSNKRRPLNVQQAQLEIAIFRQHQDRTSLEDEQNVHELWNRRLEMSYGRVAHCCPGQYAQHTF